MYKYFIYGLITYLSVYAFVFYISLGKPSNTSKWVHDVYEKKTELAYKTNSPRIVISAGSSSMFGIDSKMLGRAFDMPVINYSVNAGLMLPVILYKTKQILKEGDILIMPLEYDMYLYNGEPNEQMTDYISSYEPSILKSLTIQEQLRIFWNTPLKSIVTKYVQDVQVPQGLYGAHNIDENGDQIGSEKSKQSEAFKKEVQAAKPYEYDKLYKGDELAYMYLREFAQYCRQKHIRLILTPPALLYKKEYKNQRFFKKFIDRLTKEGFTYIGTPYNYMYSQDSFFNTDYHLHSQARAVNTKRLIKDLSETKLKLCP